MVRAVGMTQTFLSPAQVDELVASYEAGATLVELGELVMELLIDLGFGGGSACWWMGVRGRPACCCAGCSAWLSAWWSGSAGGNG